MFTFIIYMHNINMTNYKSSIVKIFKCCEMEAFEMNHPFIGTEHFILSCLKYDKDIKNIFNNYNITYEVYKNELISRSYNFNCYYNSNIIYTPLFKKILYYCNESKPVSVFLAILDNDEGIGISILNELKIDLISLRNSLKNDVEFDIGNNLNSNNILIGRDKEINIIIENLKRKNKCNTLLLGDPGVGKTAIVEELSKRIKNNDVPEFLLNYKVLSISTSSLVSGTKYRGEFEEKLEKIIKRISNNKIILFIDEIHTLVGAGGAEGAIDASNILKPYLSRNDIKCIGSTTITEYNNTIKKDKALDRRFNKIIINEPNKTELLNIMNGIKKEYENFHNVIISNNCIDYIINSNINNSKKEPDRSIDILDNICSKASIYLRNNEIVKLKIKLNETISNKNKFIKEKNYNLCIKYKELENKIINRINNYKPKITINYIKNTLNNNINSNNIGFL